MKYFKAIKDWISNYPNPIELEQNDVVKIIRKEETNPNWKGWIFCSILNSSGWIPEQIIDNIGGRKGLIREKYSAKELNIEKGEKLIGLKKLNGWFWVRRKLDDDEGWLPIDILTEISKNEYNF